PASDSRTSCVSTHENPTASASRRNRLSRRAGFALKWHRFIQSSRRMYAIHRPLSRRACPPRRASATAHAAGKPAGYMALTSLVARSLIMHESARLLRDLVAIPSVNPMGRDIKGPDIFEHRLTDYLENFFRTLGVPYQRQPIAP